MEQGDYVFSLAERPVFIGFPKGRAQALFAGCVILLTYQITSSQVLDCCSNKKPEDMRWGVIVPLNFSNRNCLSYNAV